MEELKRAVLRALLEEIGVLLSGCDGAQDAQQYAEARGNAELCIKILHEIGMPEHAEPPENSVVAWGMNSVDAFVVKSFHAAGEDAQSEILDILKNRAFEKRKF